MNMSNHYTMLPAASAAVATELKEFSPLLQRLLNARGITTKSKADEFFSPNFEAQLHSPLLLHDMITACDRIQSAILTNERIAIFSDYDCDGIPGAVVLYDFFTLVGYTNFQNYIPHRHFEGFGLSVEAVKKLKADNVALIITIDCGTTDTAAIVYAQQCGIDVVVTDHHEPPTTLPPAVAIVNPKLGTYPFPHLCGAGVVFKLVQALIATGEYTITSGQEKWWLDMVGIATIADMVPLIGENRVLAHYGLRVLRKSRRPGLQQLFKKARIDQRYLTEDDVGFTIGPRINAASRMDAPERAFNMLTTTDEGEAGSTVAYLESLNNERKGAVAVMTRELHGRIDELETIPEVIVFGNPLWRPALVGLAANKLAEEHNRPVFLWGRDGNGIIKGSCRSGGSVSVVRLMDKIAPAFLEYGGHHMSGGFSVGDEVIFSLSQKLNDAYVTLGEAVRVDVALVVDATISLSEVSLVYQSIAPFAPFGASNPRPLFALTETPVSVAWFGKAGEHLKLTFSAGASDIEAIAFFAKTTVFTKSLEIGISCTLLAHIEESFFMGRKQLRLRIVDIV